MRAAFKWLASGVLIPLTRWYLRKARSWKYRGVKVVVEPGVFHPGLFSSSVFLVDYLLEQPLRGKKVLELGCGTGLISLLSAKAGAVVTSSDLNPKAVENTQKNAVGNGLRLDVILSDLFASIPVQAFDWIAVNPPYYARNPQDSEELAWYCGADFEYFRRFFDEAGRYRHSETSIIMVLSKGCDLDKIGEIAHRAGYRMEVVKEKNVLFDGKNYLFSIRPGV